jgi:hypothetical protein
LRNPKKGAGSAYRILQEGQCLEIYKLALEIDESSILVPPSSLKHSQEFCWTKK